MVTEWVGPPGLQVELAPLTKQSTSGKHLQLILRPWAYLYDQVAHGIKRFDDIKATNKEIMHTFITPGEVYVKIGGDHGGNSFKMCYQISKINNPNRKENTVVSLFEARDSRSNLRVCLARFQSEVNMLHGKFIFLLIKLIKLLKVFAKLFKYDSFTKKSPGNIWKTVIPKHLRTLRPRKLIHIVRYPFNKPTWGNITHRNILRSMKIMFRPRYVSNVLGSKSYSGCKIWIKWSLKAITPI